MLTVEYIVEGSAEWIDESEANRADCHVKFAEFSETVPFTADINDAEPHASVILDAIKSGDAGPVTPFAVVKEHWDKLAVKGRILSISPDYSFSGDETLSELNAIFDGLNPE